MTTKARHGETTANDHDRDYEKLHTKMDYGPIWIFSMCPNPGARLCWRCRADSVWCILLDNLNHLQSDGRSDADQCLLECLDWLHDKRQGSIVAVVRSGADRAKWEN